MRFIPTVLSLAVAIGASHGAAPSARSAPIDNIPGVPLVTTDVVSSIGGEAYDHVYALDVEPGTVLLVTLRGEPGAELGLYLFDGEATSVFESEPLASSARPGSDQSVSTQFFGEARIFINVNGRNEDRPYEYQLHISAVVDRTPPVIRLAEADARVRPGAACATVDAVDGISGVQSIAILSNRNDTIEDWVPYTGRKRYCGVLALDDGPHALVVASRNSIGLVSYKSAGESVFDSVPPEVVGIYPLEHTFFGSRPIIKWRFSEPIRSTVPRALRVLSIAQTGAAVAGRSWFSADRKTLYWQPSASIAIGTLLSAVPAAVADLAGNKLSLVEPIVMTRKMRTTLAFNVPNVGRKRVELTLVSSPNLVGKTVTISERIAGSWVLVVSVIITGLVTRVLVPRSEATRYEAVWGGSDWLDAARAVGAAR